MFAPRLTRAVVERALKQARDAATSRTEAAR